MSQYDFQQAEMPPQTESIDRLDLIKTMLKVTSNLTQLADRKAQLLLRLALGLFMVAFVGVPPAVMALKRFIDEGGWKLAIFIGVAVLYVLCAVCLIMAIMTIIEVIRPRITLSDDVKTDLFFGSVARMDYQEFRRKMRSIDQEEAIDELINQAYVSAQIAELKYEKLNKAISWMLGGGVVGVAFALILLVSSGLM